ncbi:MAG TPA: phosphotransferase [Kouleothrix sp.]|uniref:phosphotransferase family protein n=1 Tax=Kouleothrix sp. TaxID=2779161 RepID=UPI002BA4F833|nr:phosphotransferase [Kouleothrix sp.]
MALDIEDPAALTDYLRRAGHIPAGASPRISVLAGGVSNRTVLVEHPPAVSWVLKQALAKLRVQVDWFSDPARVHREALGLRALPELAPPGSIPALIFEDDAEHLLAMAAVPQPHANWKQLLLAEGPQPAHVAQFAAILGQIHARSHDQAGRFAALFGERGFFESLRIEPYYLYAAQQAPAAADFVAALVADTRASRLAIVHGDYSPKNILVHGGRLILLDHEVIHWGDPAFDVGFALTHLLSKAHHLPARRGAFVQAAHAFWSEYSGVVAQRFGANYGQRAARHLAACLLARVAGRSPLEYLSADERERQLRAALGLIARPPASVPACISQFIESIAP